MARKPLDSVLQQLRTMFLAKDAEHLSDIDLTHRFAERRNEAAFAALVSRHGGLVFKACRRILHREADAEDAFQATFLVLARKAATIRSGTSLAGWLHRVAFHCAMKLRNSDMQRRKREEKASPGSLIESPIVTAAMNELQVFLDEEIERLPDKYRIAFILCCLEGKSRADAAQIVGLKEGTLASRLAKAREILKARLLARGVSLSAALGAVALSGTAAAETISPTLIHRTIDAALAFIAGNAAGTVSTQVLAVAEGVLRTMFVAKLKLGVTLLLVASLGAFAASGPVALPKASDIPIADRVVVALPANDDEPKAKPATDLHGDSLPQGAIARLGTVRLNAAHQIGQLAFSPDGKKLVARGETKISIWDTESGQKLSETAAVYPPGAPGNFMALAWKADGSGVILVNERGGTPWIGDFTSAKLDKPPGADLQMPSAAANPMDPLADNERITRYAISPDGKYLVTGRSGNHDRARAITVWEIEIGKPISELRRVRDLGPQHGNCHQIVFSPDSKFVGVINLPGSLRSIDPTAPPPAIPFVLYDLATGVERFKRDIPMPGMTTGRESWGRLSVALSTEGRYLAVGEGRSVCHVYAMDRGGAENSFGEAKKEGIFSRGWSAVTFAGDQVWGHTWNNRLYVHDSKTGQAIRPPLSVGGRMDAMAVSPDGTRLATAGGDMAGPAGVVRIFDVATGRQIGPATGHCGMVWDVKFVGDGAQAMTWGYDRVPRLWELASGKELRRMSLPNEWDHYSGLIPSPDGKTFLTTVDGKVHTLDAAKGAPSPAPENLAKVTGDLLPNGSDSHFLLTHDAASIRVWEWPDGRLRGKIERKANAKTSEAMPPREASLSPDGKSLITRESVATSLCDVYLWDVETGARKAQLVKGDRSYGGGIAFLNNGRHFALVGSYPEGDGKRVHVSRVGLWDLHSGRHLRTFEEAGSSMTRGIAADPRGYVLATAEEGGDGYLDGLPKSFGDGCTLLYEVASGQIRKRLPGHFYINTAAAFSLDGNRLISVGGDSTGLVWDVSLMSAARGKKPASDADFEIAWKIIAEPNAPAAYDSLIAFATNSEKAVKFLRKRLRPIAKLDAAALERLFVNLESDIFAVRERAMRDLERFGRDAAPAVRARADKTESLEAKRRLASFLEKHDTGILTPDELRGVRSVELLEHAATPAAHELLAVLSTGELTAELTIRALAAKERLDRRKN